MCQRRFHLDSRKKVFTDRVVRHWNRLLKVELPSLEVLRKHVDVALQDMVGLVVVVVGLELD